MLANFGRDVGLQVSEEDAMKVLQATKLHSLKNNGRRYLRLLQPNGRTPCPRASTRFIELIGTSSESWEKAAANALAEAAKSLRDLRVAEVVELDLQLDAKGKVEAYRTKLNVSFKFEGT